MEQITILMFIILTLSFKSIIKQLLLIKSFRNTNLIIILNNQILEEILFKSRIMKLKLIILNMAI